MMWLRPGRNFILFLVGGSRSVFKRFNLNCSQAATTFVQSELEQGREEMC